MKNLRTNWKRHPIGSLCNLINGRAFKPSDWGTKGLPIVRIQNLNNPNAKFNYFPRDQVRERFLIDTGALLFAWSGTPGTSFGAHIWSGGPAILNQHIFHVVFDETAIDKKFLRFAINQKLDELIDKAHGGVGLRHVTKGKFEETEIDLPPLEEQRRIVAKVEGLLNLSGEARTELSHVPKLANRYKQALLLHSFRGDGKIEWPLVPLESLITEGPTNGYSPRADDAAGGTLSLKLSATTKGVFDLSERCVKRLNETIAPSSKFWLRPGDILIQRSNSLEYVGVCAIYEGPESTYIYPDLMIRIRVASPILGRWIWTYCGSSAARKYFTSNATGTSGNMPKINGATVRQLMIPLPPEDILPLCLEKIERALKETENLYSQVESADALTERMEHAILQKAFRGELSGAAA